LQTLVKSSWNTLVKLNCCLYFSFDESRSNKEFLVAGGILIVFCENPW